MDADRFDALTQSLTTAGSRRGALAALLGGTLGLLGLAETAAKKRKKKKKKKKGGNASALPPPPPPPPPPSPPPLPLICRDGVWNGDESDVDCGGRTCPRCPDGKFCFSRNDCASAYCTSTSDGFCQACATSIDCPGDPSGTCVCDQPATGGSKICRKNAAESTATDCTLCPTGTVCFFAGTNFCHKRCGA